MLQALVAKQRKWKRKKCSSFTRSNLFLSIESNFSLRTKKYTFWHFFLKMGIFNFPVCFNFPQKVLTWDRFHWYSRSKLVFSMNFLLKLGFSYNVHILPAIWALLLIGASSCGNADQPLKALIWIEHIRVFHKFIQKLAILASEALLCEIKKVWAT